MTGNSLILAQATQHSPFSTNTAISMPSTEKTENQKGYAEHIVQSVPEIVLSLVVGICLGWFGHVLACQQDDRKRRIEAKDQFGIFLTKMLTDLPERGVAEFYKSTKPEMQTAYSRFWHFSNDNTRKRLDALWAEYDAITESDLSKANEGARGDMMQAGYRSIHSPVIPPTNQQRLKMLLERFYSLCA